jgi:hypothetical protein
VSATLRGLLIAHSLPADIQVKKEYGYEPHGRR